MDHMCAWEETDPITNPSFSMTAFILFCESVWMIPLWNGAVVMDADITDVKFNFLKVRVNLPFSYLTPAPTLQYLPSIAENTVSPKKAVIILVPANVDFVVLALGWLGRCLKQIIYIFYSNKPNSFQFNSRFLKCKQCTIFSIEIC